MSEKSNFMIIKDVLQEMGIIIENGDRDNILSECIEDSITFITFLASLEERLKINFPDEYIDYNLLESIEYLDSVINKLKGNSFGENA